MNLIDGKAVSASVKEQIRAEIERDKLDIGLAVIIVGNNQASRVYVNNKKKACEVCGIKSYEYALPEDTTQDELMELIDTLNKDDKVNGILCQLPLPKHLDEEKVIEAISPLKDVDAFNAVNVGKIMIGNYSFLPCTPAGVMELIHSTGVSVEGKECVVIGRSNIVGKPMAIRREGKVGYGFDAQNEVYGDMIAAGIVDPAKVTRSALQNAASVAAMVLTTESLVADKKEENPAPAMPAGGMGGMAGM